MRSLWIVASTAVVVGCSPNDTGDSSDLLPPEDTAPRDTGEPWEFVDTGGAANPDDTPEHLLTIRQWGAWTLSPPAASDYTSLTGSLRVQEYLDGLRPPEDTGDTGGVAGEPVVLECDLVYQVSGVPYTEATCPGCDFTFRVEFALTSGDPSACHDPELPAHGDQWTVGYHSDGSVLRDYGDTGLWFPWYGATKTGDVVDLEWEVDVGVAVEEEDP